MTNRDPGWKRRASVAKRYRMKIAPEGTRLPNPDTVFLYERKGDVIRLKTVGQTNHEMQAIIVGIWLRFDEADRRQVIEELTAYQDPEEVPSPVSRAIVEAWS